MAENFEIMKHHHSVCAARAILVGMLFGPSCFKPIPFKQIGIRSNPDRARLAQFE